MAWAALFANGTILRSSAGVPVPEGVFSDVSLTVEVPDGSVSPGTYDFLVVLSGDQSSVGNLAAHAAISNLQRVTIAHIACTPPPGCIMVRYGDTLKLKANMVGSNLVITSRGPGEFSDAGVQWASVNAAPGG